MRARNIKPGLFKNELLGEADPIVTLLFISLWCQADRDGRLEDRPLRIKAEAFPYRDTVTLSLFNGYLTELEQLGFINRYEVDGIKVIEVSNFTKHQSPHNTEKSSILPANPTNKRVVNLTVNSPLNNDGLTQAKRSDSLIPDSLIADLPKEENAPAYTLYREFFPKFQLGIHQETALQTAEVDEAEFRECLKFWAGHGYAERNVIGLLDCYNSKNYKPKPTKPETKPEPKVMSGRERAAELDWIQKNTKIIMPTPRNGTKKNDNNQ